MGRTRIAPLVKETFSLLLDDPTGPGAEILVRFRGTADMEATSALEHFLKRLHNEASRSRARVVFDISQLGFMNSSCFKCFISWIDQVSKLAAEARYEVRFLANPELQWQRRSLEGLHRFAPDVVTLDAA